MKPSRLLPLVLALFVHQATAAVSLKTEDAAATTVPSTIEGPIKEALEAFNDGRHVKAIDLARPLAEKGNADAMFLMGVA
ncbi:MAG TPA: hypothetical protein DDW21_03770, partial [Verrucomicrobiales bacterium]|nr:hypothetical protein [Verrucomicrobiales bacterium]